MVTNSNDIQPQPTPQSLTKTSKRLKYKDDPTSTSSKFNRLKIFKTTATQRAAKRYWYRHNGKHLLLKSKLKHKKTGIIHLLNENPHIDIQQLLQSKATASLPLIIPATTNKKWSEVLDYKQTDLGTTTTTKRQRTDHPPTVSSNTDPPAKKAHTTTREAINRSQRENYSHRKQLQHSHKTNSSIHTTTPTSLVPTLSQPSLEVTEHKLYRKRKQPDTPSILTNETPPVKIFKTPESLRRNNRESYHRHRIPILDKRKEKRTLNTTTPILEPTPTLPQQSLAVVTTNIPSTSTMTLSLPSNKRKINASSTTSITDYFTKKTKPNNDDDKPP
jgi:hypothetical protein